MLALADFDLMHPDWTPETPELTPVLLLLDLSKWPLSLPGARPIVPLLPTVCRLSGMQAEIVAVQVLGQATLEKRETTRTRE